SAKDYNFMSVQSPVATNLPLAVGAGYAIKYRTDTIKDGSDGDPIVIAEKKMKEKGYLTDADIEKIKNDAKELVDRKFEEREKVPPPKPETMFLDVYEKPTWIIEEEKEEIL
ncbi:MAG: hypothetical protein M1375_00700, partial [Candidatus Thermoplasmatota archaeon]|nr:hypothetical protein [Candidatus Thermoplasmatota archaeon]